MVLNTNCFLEILKRLSLHDLANFKETYDRLGAIADMDFYRRTFGTLSFEDENMIDEALQIIKQFGSSVNDLRFNYKSLNGSTWSEIFSVVNEHCNEKLKHLSLIGDSIGLIEKANVSLITEILRKVETLKLINWNKNDRWPKDFIDIVSCCESVTDITLVALGGIDVPEAMFQMNKSLQSLQWFGRMKGDDLNTIIHNLLHTRLENLILQSTKLEPNENESLLQIEKLNRLKSLCIDCNRVDIGPFLLNLALCSSLNDLSLCNARLDGSNVEALGRMAQLDTLRLDTNCFFATSSQFESVLVLCANTNLDYIHILCYEGAINRTNFLRLVEKRKYSDAGKCLLLTLRHVVYTASLLEVPYDLLVANVKTITLIDEYDHGVKLLK